MSSVRAIWARGGAGLVESADGGDGVGGETGAAGVSTGRAGCRNSGGGAFSGDGPLELGDGAEHVEDQPAAVVVSMASVRERSSTPRSWRSLAMVSRWGSERPRRSSRQTRSTSPRRGEAGWAGLRAALQQVEKAQLHRSVDVEQAVRDINITTVASVPGAQYAGITVVNASGAVSSFATTHKWLQMLDDIQEQEREGPCLSAAWQSNVIRVEDLGTDQRWPRYSRAVLERTPIRSVVAIRMYFEGKSLAALNFLAERPHAFDDDSVEIAQVVAIHTSLVWNSLRREDQFQTALGSRDLIGQAKGMLMERFKIDAVKAFDLLRQLSQDLNIKLAEIARRIIESEDLSS